MLGRQVGSSLLRLPIHSRLILRPTAPFQSSCPQDLAARALIFSSIRHYATPGRPRKAVGEPSKPVKRAAKRQAKSTSTDDPATKLVKSRKTASKPKTTKAAPKKVKKPLTEKQKEAKAETKEKARIKELREQALKPPRTGRTMSAFQAYVKENTQGKKTNSIADVLKQLAQEWKTVAPAQHEHYNHLATQQTEAFRAEYKHWVESHSPEQIKQANRARSQLNKKFVPKPTTGKHQRRPKFPQINDERQPKQPIGSFILFAKNRQESGDFKNIAIPERARLIGKEWRALTVAEKQKYKELEIEDKSRYSSEFQDAYGYMPPNINGGLQAASASA